MLPHKKGILVSLYTYQARLLHVVDGDTVDLEVDLGFYLRTSLRFRLLGVDTPELRARGPEGEQAKRFVEDWFSSRATGEWPFTIQTSKTDSFGRWLASIQDDSGESLAEALLAAEHATIYRDP